MKKAILFHIIILLFTSKLVSQNNEKNGTTKETSYLTHDYKDMKALFNLSPLSIFNETTEGITLSEKKELLKKGESTSWKITNKNKTKLTIQNKNLSSQVTLYFLKNKDNLDGVLFTEIENGRNNNIHSWKYINKSETLQKINILKKYSANDFVRKEEKLPDSYQPLLYYLFIDDQTIEVSLHTFMEKEFETREIINKIFLKWNGENFVEKIERIKE
ncbi:hypothetical protein [Algibacter sp. L4_22]|uniref:hypothetical protein n=1 Tax=Algibacter sp. L4_22 TaxID=2942477 RepID=UPI00201B8B13|nr:hypothetical protein [Algibacter sp. L4_22]MCL5128524.1 hypothetical protein [Algibacter sp. L4_22]